MIPMALSNTATPIYYGQFRERVLRGEILVCNEISMQMTLIDELIKNPAYYYDDEAVLGWVDFCENELTLTDGSDLHLLDTFKLWAEDIFGWYYFTDENVYVPDGTSGHYEFRRIKKRLRNKQYLIVPRGNAKSMYAATIQAYYCAVDVSTTDQFVVAPTMRQANETVSPIITALSRSRGPLFKFLTDGNISNTKGDPRNHVKMASTKKGIQNFLTNSMIEVRPMAIDKLQGARLKVATVDEWLSGDVKEDVIGALEQGASKNQSGGQNDDWLIVATSSEGTVRNGVGDTIKMELQSLLRGDYYDPHTSIWYYKLDEVAEVGNPKCWVKASPNIGITVSYETYQREVERAERNPSVRNDILAKRFDIPMEGYTYFFPYEETLPHRPQNFDGMPCALGADLSRGDDFCAFTCLFPLSGGALGTKTLCFITKRTQDLLPGALYAKYQDFIHEGSLIVLDGTVLDIENEVYPEVMRWLDAHKYYSRAFGYDPYNAFGFVNRYCADNGDYGVEKVIQGARTESVPLGELKAYSEDRRLIFDQAIMSFCMGNAIVIKDTNANRKLYKSRKEQKIDSVAALLDAYVVYRRYQYEFE